jgi:hypothetical protein
MISFRLEGSVLELYVPGGVLEFSGVETVEYRLDDNDQMSEDNLNNVNDQLNDTLVLTQETFQDILNNYVQREQTESQQPRREPLTASVFQSLINNAQN